MTKQVRDWQKDTELLQKKPRYTIDEVNHIIYNVAPYWIQQYAAEKERAEAAETREKKLREAIVEALSWTWDCAEGNMLEVSSILHSSLYPEEGTPQVKPLNNEDMKASQAFINRAMKED